MQKGSGDRGRGNFCAPSAGTVAAYSYAHVSDSGDVLRKYRSK